MEEPAPPVVTSSPIKGRVCMPMGGAAATASVHEVTCLLQAWGSGDETALALLMPMVYSELRELSREVSR